jgi:two-component system, OmpR family, sensor histidine kinase KdpD
MTSPMILGLCQGDVMTPDAPEVVDRSTRTSLLPPTTGGVSSSRRMIGLVLVAVGLPALTGVLVLARDDLSLGTLLLLYLLAVVIVAVIGGTLPAVLAAVASFLLANWYLTPPYHTFVVEQRDSVISLVVFVFGALVVSVTVDAAARHRVSAARTRAEVELLSRFTAEPVTETSLPVVLEQVRQLFGMTTVALVKREERRDEVVGIVGPPMEGAPALTVDINPGLRLVAAGPDLFAEDRPLLARLADTAARAWEGQDLAEKAAQAQQLAEVDRLRSALLAAVSHDLRTPLAAVKAAVTSLRQRDVTWTREEQDELLATIEGSADRLDDLITNLLAMSRLQAGALSVDVQPVALDGVVAQALLDVRDDQIDIDVPDDLPSVLADPGLLERVVANLVRNARRYSPPGDRVKIHAGASEETVVSLRVMDHGPGVPERQWEAIFAPFQRLDDHSSEGSVGLGLAIARGFVEAMNGELTPSETPGGGLTMTVTLHSAT